MKDFLEEQGYKKKGKVYTPPILQLGQFIPVHWIEELVPELFWIGLFQQRFGFAEGSNLASELSKEALSIVDDKSIWFALVSNFNGLKDEERFKLKEKLRIKRKLATIQEVVSPVCYYYSDFPLNFLLDTSPVNGLDLNIFKAYLESVFDRTTIPANLLQGVTLDMLFGTNIDFQINPNLPLAQFPKFSEYPLTEISKEVASAIRSTINMFYANMYRTNTNTAWQTYFWNRGLQIDTCK